MCASLASRKSVRDVSLFLPVSVWELRTKRWMRHVGLGLAWDIGRGHLGGVGGGVLSPEPYGDSYKAGGEVHGPK